MNTIRNRKLKKQGLDFDPDLETGSCNHSQIYCIVIYECLLKFYGYQMIKSSWKFQFAKKLNFFVLIRIVISFRSASSLHDTKLVLFRCKKTV